MKFLYCSGQSECSNQWQCSPEIHAGCEQIIYMLASCKCYAVLQIFMNARIQFSCKSAVTSNSTHTQQTTTSFARKRGFHAQQFHKCGWSTESNGTGLDMTYFTDRHIHYNFGVSLARALTSKHHFGRRKFTQSARQFILILQHFDGNDSFNASASRQCQCVSRAFVSLIWWVELSLLVWQRIFWPRN